MSPFDRVRKTLDACERRIDSIGCRHESTHRGGVLWTICDDCGGLWADDDGGKPEYVEPKEIALITQAITALAEIEREQGSWRLRAEQAEAALAQNELVERERDELRAKLAAEIANEADAEIGRLKERIAELERLLGEARDCVVEELNHAQVSRDRDYHASLLAEIDKAMEAGK